MSAEEIRAFEQRKNELLEIEAMKQELKDEAYRFAEKPVRKTKKSVGVYQIYRLGENKRFFVGEVEAATSKAALLNYGDKGNIFKVPGGAWVLRENEEQFIALKKNTKGK